MSNKEFIYGIHPIQTLLEQEPQHILRLRVQVDKTDRKLDQLVQVAKSLNIPVDYVDKHELDIISNNANHQGIVAFCVKKHVYHERDLPKILADKATPFILILDGVQDPHNLGACFRSADAAGVDLIIAPKDNATGITPVVSKVSSGATETVPFMQVTNLARTLKLLKEKGIWLYGASEHAQDSIFNTKLTGAIGLVLGAEGTGLRRLTKEHCDYLIKIPMQGSIDSLNVSVAAGICMFEVVRQRLK